MKKKIICLAAACAVFAVFVVAGLWLYGFITVGNGKIEIITNGANSIKTVGVAGLKNEEKEPEKPDNTDKNGTDDPSKNTETPSKDNEKPVKPVKPEKPAVNPEKPAPDVSTAEGFVSAPDGYFDDALIIGDSRAEDLKYYGKIDGADFFTVVGLSIYNVWKKTATVGGVETNITDLLSSKKYGKIYIITGVNECGYNIKQTVKKYGAFIDKVKEMQPNAIIYANANIHITKKESDKNIYDCNNGSLNALNEGIKGLADNKTVYYLDVNPIFDDENGNLRADYTGDGTHLYAKYTIKWADWLKSNVIVK